MSNMMSVFAKTFKNDICYFCLLFRSSLWLGRRAECHFINTFMDCQSVSKTARTLRMPIKLVVHHHRQCLVLTGFAETQRQNTSLLVSSRKPFKLKGLVADWNSSTKDGPCPAVSNNGCFIACRQAVSPSKAELGSVLAYPYPRVPHASSHFKVK